MESWLLLFGLFGLRAYNRVLLEDVVAAAGVVVVVLVEDRYALVFVEVSERGPKAGDILLDSALAVYCCCCCCGMVRYPAPLVGM